MALEDPQQPAQEQPNPYLPAGPEPLVFDKWMGLDTSSVRASIDDEHAYWLDGFFPVGPNNLRTLFGVGTTLYTAPGGITIVFFGFFNIGAAPYCVVFLSDGSVVAVRTDTGATSTVLPASSILNPSILSQGISQWGRQYLIIVSNQTNGYWLWDGAVTYGAGTLAPTVVITNAGQAYKTAPTVVVSGGHGSGAVLTANVANGQVTSITVVNSGTGYVAGDAPTITMSGGTSAGTGATLTAVLTQKTGGSGASLTAVFTFVAPFWNVTSVTINNGGSGYSQFTTLTVSGGSPQTAAVISLIITGGVVTGTIISNSGHYNTSTPPTLTVTDGGGYYVSSVTGTPTGTGYSPSTTVTGSGGGSPIVQASYSPVITGGVITSVVVTSGGLYGSNTPPTLAVNDSSVTATATISLMPFAISGTAVETYTGHVWVANGPIIYYSAPGSFSDFAASDGGGNFTSNDSFLKVNYTQLLQTNGFLYLIGDSSVNYISGVQTSGTPPSTTFSNQNADPELGSPYPASVETFGRDILFANNLGVFVSYGGAVTKNSKELDGVWNSVANFGGQQLCAAKANIFGKKVWMVLSNIVDPVSGVSGNKLFLWYDKKWFAATQDIPLTFIKHQEINSVITAWGTDGTTIRPLFSQASSAILKTAQSKLWMAPGGYIFKKATGRFWGLANYNSVILPNLTVTIDQNAPANGQTYTIAGPAATGYFVIPPQAVGQVGELTGMTIKTNCPDMSLVSAMMDDKIVGYRG